MGTSNKNLVIYQIVFIGDEIRCAVYLDKQAFIHDAKLLIQTHNLSHDARYVWRSSDKILITAKLKPT